MDKKEPNVESRLRLLLSKAMFDPFVGFLQLDSTGQRARAATLTFPTPELAQTAAILLIKEKTVPQGLKLTDNQCSFAMSEEFLQKYGRHLSIPKSENKTNVRQDINIKTAENYRAAANDEVLLILSEIQATGKGDINYNSVTWKIRSPEEDEQVISLSGRLKDGLEKKGYAGVTINTSQFVQISQDAKDPKFKSPAVRFATEYYDKLGNNNVELSEALAKYVLNYKGYAKQTAQPATR